MEMQFYRRDGCRGLLAAAATQRSGAPRSTSTASLQTKNTGQVLNATCQKRTGEEYVNFAFITRSGIPQAPPNPVESTGGDGNAESVSGLVHELRRPPDRESARRHERLVVVIADLTTHQVGSMTASAANGFGEVQFAPTGSRAPTSPTTSTPCTSTSSEDTRVPWTAHSYNIAFSDETGHFSYCNKAAPGSLKCAQAGVSDPNGADGDDTSCFNASQSLSVPISGCQGTEFDFDGVSLRRHLAWNVSLTPVRMPSDTRARSYSRAL